MTDPTLGSKFLAVFDCLPAPGEYDGVETSLMREDPYIECGSFQWHRVVALGVTGIVVYCIGFPVFAVMQIRRWQTTKEDINLTRAEKTERYERVSFLVGQYEERFWYFEVVWLVHKFLFTSVIPVLMPGTAIQIWAGAILSVIFLTIGVETKPYVSGMLDWVQVTALLQLMLTYLSMPLFLMDAEDRTPVEDLQPELWGAILITTNCLVFVSLVVMMILGYRQERLAQKQADLRKLQTLKNSVVVDIPVLPDGCLYHLFLSHVWVTGQDQMRVLKQRLLETLPDVSIFLDIDDMEEGVGKEYLDKSSICLVFCTAGYFESKNCMRELLRAVLKRVKIITVMEPEAIHGKMTKEQVREALEKAEANYDRWGLAAEVETWTQEDGTGPLPDFETLYDALFEDQDAIEWNRFKHYQDVSVRLIANGIIDKCGETYVPAELIHKVVIGGVPKLTLPMKFHVFASANNYGAADIIAEMSKDLGVQIKGLVKSRSRKRNNAMFNPASLKRAGSRITFHSSGSSVLGESSPVGKLVRRARGSSLSTADVPMIVTERKEDLPACRIMLVYLTAKTWTLGEEVSRAFAEEILLAMKLGIPMVLVHETPSVVETDDYRDACPFEHFFSHADGSTPPEIIKAGLYNSIALAMKAGHWRDVSLKMLAMKLVGTSIKGKLDLRKYHYRLATRARWWQKHVSSFSSGVARRMSSFRLSSRTKRKDILDVEISEMSAREIDFDEEAAQATEEKRILGALISARLEQQTLSSEERSRVVDRVQRARAFYYARSNGMDSASSARVRRASDSADNDADDMSVAGSMMTGLSAPGPAGRRQERDLGIPDNLSDPGAHWAPSLEIDEDDRDAAPPSPHSHAQTLLAQRAKAAQWSESSIVAQPIDEMMWSQPRVVRAFERATELDGNRQALDRHLSSVGIVYTSIRPKINDHMRGVGSLRFDLKRARRKVAVKQLPQSDPPNWQLDEGMKQAMDQVVQFATTMGLEKIKVVKLLHCAQNLGLDQSDLLRGLQRGGAAEDDAEVIVEPTSRFRYFLQLRKQARVPMRASLPSRLGMPSSMGRRIVKMTEPVLDASPKQDAVLWRV